MERNEESSPAQDSIVNQYGPDWNILAALCTDMIFGTDDSSQ